MNYKRITEKRDGKLIKNTERELRNTERIIGEKIMKKQNQKSNRISVEEILKEWGSDKNLSRIIPTHYYKKYKIRKKTK